MYIHLLLQVCISYSLGICALQLCNHCPHVLSYHMLICNHINHIFDKTLLIRIATMGVKERPCARALKL